MSGSSFPAIVPQGLNDADDIIFGRSLEDFLYFVFLPIFITFVFMIFDFIPFFYLVVLDVAILVTAVVIFRKAGTNKSAMEYLQATIHRKQLPTHAQPGGASIDTESRPLFPDGGEISEVFEDATTDIENTSVWESTEDALDYTRIRRVFPEFDAIQRADGTYIAAIKISGTSVYLRSQTQKDRLVSQFASVLREIDFPTEIFLTREEFDITKHEEMHAEAANHEDVLENPILQELHQTYQSEVLDDPKIQETRKSKIYGIVQVHPLEPEVGHDQSADVTPGSEADLRRRKEALEALVDRRQKYISLISNIDGVTATAADHQDHLGQLRAHWNNPLNDAEIEVEANPITTDDIR